MDACIRGTMSLWCVVMISWVSLLHAADYSISGTVTNSEGQPVQGALVTLIGRDVYAATDASGRYQLSGTMSTPVVKTAGIRVGNTVTFTGNEAFFSVQEPTMVGMKVFTANGTRVVDISPKTYPSGNHSLRWSGTLNVSQFYIVHIQHDNKTHHFKYLHLGGKRTYSFKRNNSSGLAKKADQSTQELDQLRASAAGYMSKTNAVTTFTGTYDFVLDSAVSAENSTPSQESGSADRLEAWGNEQYFWGDMGNGNEPMVKIITAESDDVVDLAVIFNPHFVDNTYGENRVVWNKHTFTDLVRSDHVALTIRNGNGEAVFEGRLDLISKDETAPSGYATYGPRGGDGRMSVGSSDDILSYSTSLDENLNYHGYELLENSPATDSIYTPNPQYPNWEYYVIYTLSIKAEAFGESGYGDVAMTSVHASPSKGNETVTVTEGETPTEKEDVFKYTLPSSPGGNVPPGDGSDNPGTPPGDGSDNPGTPPGDGSDNPGTPPGDGSDDPGTPPPDDGTDVPVYPPDDGTDDPANPPDDGTDDPANPPDDGTDDPANPPDDGTDDPANPPGDGTDDPANPPGDGTDDPANPPDDGTDDPANPPDDGTDDPANPPGDGTDDPANPPDDGTDDPNNPPGDGTGDPSSPPPGDGTDIPIYPPDDGTDDPANPPDDGTDDPANPPDDGTDDPSNPPGDGTDTDLPPEDEMEGS